MPEGIPCPWCFKTFASLVARYSHARASHTGKDMTEVAFDIIDGIQIPRTPGNMRSIGEIIAPIVSRVRADR